MGMVDDRRRDRRGPALALDPHGLGPFHDAPAVVSPALDPEDHLPELPADVADPQVAGRVVDAHLPGVAEAERPDLGADVGRLEERVVGRDPVRQAPLGVIDVDAEDAREQVRAVLSGELAVGGRRIGPVARGNVKISIVAEIEAAAVMPARPEPEEHLLAPGIERGRIGRAHLESRDDRAVVHVVLEHIADVDVAILLELRMEREPVERGEIRVRFGQVHDEVGPPAAGVGGERPDPAFQFAQEEPSRSRRADHHEREFELQVREGELDGVRRRGIGRADDPRAVPGRPLRETQACRGASGIRCPCQAILGLRGAPAWPLARAESERHTRGDDPQEADSA